MNVLEQLDLARADPALGVEVDNDTMHGNQAGDPAKAGAAIIAAVESSEPPGFLLLGPDALAAYRYIADTRASEIGKWEQLTSGTNLDS